MRVMAALVALIGAGAVPPGAAPAATVTVTGDDGAPVAMNPAAPTATRKWGRTSRWRWAQASWATQPRWPARRLAAAPPRTCSTSTPQQLDYQGNGTYTVAVTTYTNSTCTTGARPATYQIAIGAGAALTQPAPVLLTRKPNDFAPIVHQIPIALNPGALTHEIRLANGGVLAPDGSISGPSKELFAESTTGAVPVRLDAPGSYLMVARATAFTGAAGQFFSPWSTPVRFRALAPFDLSQVQFPDSRGPRYSLRGVLREKSARGKVRIKLARGSSRRFFSIGRAKVRGGVFKKKFTLHRTGRYKIKFIHSGSATTAPGTVVQKIRITRRFF